MIHIKQRCQLDAADVTPLEGGGRRGLSAGGEGKGESWEGVPGGRTASAQFLRQDHGWHV